MKIGMLWFDDDRKRNLEEKVARAAAHYTHKYGALPTIVYMHPSMLSGAQLTNAAGLVVNTAATILVDHFWLGVEEGDRRG